MMERYYSNKRATQAVIFAGGNGRRLGELTATKPKALVEVAGRPFLEHLLALLKSGGFRRILILTGHLGDEIEGHIARQVSGGLEVSCHHSPGEVETGTRLRSAAHLLEPQFCIAYCDNYAPIDFRQLQDLFVRKHVSGVLSVYVNDDGYSRSNVHVNDGGMIEVYDPTRKRSGLNGVEIGFGLFRKEVVDLLPPGNVCFQYEIYPQLAHAGTLAAQLQRHRYYGVGTPERLAQTRAFFAQQPTVMVDRDGVLNVKPKSGRYVTAWSEWTWAEGALDALAMLRRRGVRTLVLTNQAGVARGHLTSGGLQLVHRRMCEEVRHAGGEIAGVFVCHHGWDEGCACRKPKPGLFYLAQKQFDLNLSLVPYFGDDDRDEIAALKAGCPFERISERRSLLDVVRQYLSECR